MTLVGELRRRAAEEEALRAAVVGRDTIEAEQHLGALRAYKAAADLVEADPLYKAAPKLKELVVRAKKWRTEPSRSDPYTDFWKAWFEEADALLAALPEETPR